MKMAKELITAKEAAKILKISEIEVWKMVFQGRLSPEPKELLDKSRVEILAKHKKH